MPDKKSKDEVDYRPGEPGERCGVCEHFKAPARCELVAGRIDRNMWCKLFERKERP